MSSTACVRIPSDAVGGVCTTAPLPRHPVRIGYVILSMTSLPRGGDAADAAQAALERRPLTPAQLAWALLHAEEEGHRLLERVIKRHLFGGVHRVPVALRPLAFGANEVILVAVDGCARETPCGRLANGSGGCRRC